ncbi:MAG: hypothetical protein CMI31_10210 [Opitutae bacterium]|nr:hypothetical protein [Opitutae bacterium]|tara:strand:+ start:746 stop:2590 length:1845 start_codon:yes stop_codon:yes gene_type:complete
MQDFVTFRLPADPIIEQIYAMKHLINCLALVAVILPYSLAAKENLADYLPPDAWVVVEVENLAALEKDMKEGPFGEMWKSSPMENLKKLFEEGMDFPDGEEGEAIEGMFDRLKAWREKFTGQVAFSAAGLEDIMELPDDDAHLPEIIFLAETTGTAKELQELLDWFEETDQKLSDEDTDVRIEKTKVRGTVVHWFAPEDQADDNPDARFGIFVKDGILGLGGARSAVEDLVERLGKKDGKSIADNDDYRDVFDEIGRGDVRMFLDVRPFVALLHEGMRENEELSLPENPLGVTMDGVIKAMGLDCLECLAMQMDFDKRGMEMGTAMFMSKPTGLVRMLFQSVKKPVAPASFVPNDATTASVGRFDMGLFWDDLMVMMEGMSPALKIMIDTQVSAFEKQAGVSLRKDILGSLGDEMISFSEINPEEALKQEELEDIEELSANLDAFIGEFFAISLKDGDRFDKSLRTLLDALTAGAELFDEREHKGVVVRTLRDQADMTFSYAVSPKWLFINMGERSRMLKAITRSQKPRKSLWKRPDVATALEDLPNEYGSLEYMDLNVLMDLLGPLMQQGLEEATGEAPELDEMPELPFFMLSWTKQIRRGSVGKLKLFSKDD